MIQRKPNPYRDCEALRVALDEFLERAEELETAREVLYGREPLPSKKAVDRAVMTIYGAIPSLRATIDTFLWAIDQVEEDEEAMRRLSRKRKPPTH